MWIKNVSYADISTGNHPKAADNTLLIQIVDPDMGFPQPQYQFREVHQFRFLDVEESSDVLDEAMKCSQEQANELVRVLQHALDSGMNVLVHCVAGICRSGAVCEVGVMLGFEDTGVYRCPNLLVKHRMMKSLGWTHE